MIDIPKRIKSGDKALEKRVYEYCEERRDGYFRSECSNILRNRVMTLTDLNDMKTGNKSNKNKFFGNLVFPLVKERSIVRKAICAHNYRAESLITLIPIGATPKENANNMQSILDMNFRATKFRALCLRPVIDTFSEYGTAICFSEWIEAEKYAYKTVVGRAGVSERQFLPVRMQKNVFNTEIHLCDYFQDPQCAVPEWSSYQGHMDHIKLSSLMIEAKLNPDNYVKHNLNKIIENAKKGNISDQYKWKENQDWGRDYNKYGLDRARFFIELNIEGNEENKFDYYIEIVNGKIIRIQHLYELIDDDARPYSIMNMYKRREYWWANADSEFVIPHDNFTNLIMPLKAQRALQDLMSVFLYKAGSIDFSDWNERAINGGGVPVKLDQNERIRDLVYQLSPIDTSLQSTDSIMREVKEDAQKLTPRPDLARHAKEGGVRNETAYAASLLQEQGDVLETYILESFQFGMQNIGYVNTNYFQYLLPEIVYIKPNLDQDQKEINKTEILGVFNYNIETALTNNKNSELMRIQNVITGIMNFFATGHPSFQKLNLAPIIRDWVKKLDVGEVDDIYPLENEMAQPQYQESALMQGLGQNGAVGEQMQQEQEMVNALS